jgi:hypothetical protein
MRLIERRNYCRRWPRKIDVGVDVRPNEVVAAVSMLAEYSDSDSFIVNIVTTKTCRESR